MRGPRGISALDAYRRLTALHRELEDMADGCWSVAGETALRSAARMVRVLASGFFLTIRPDEGPQAENPEGSRPSRQRR